MARTAWSATNGNAPLTPEVFHRYGYLHPVGSLILPATFCGITMSTNLSLFEPAATPVYRVVGNPLAPDIDASLPKAAETVEIAVQKGGLNLADRRLYNVLLAHAYPSLLERESHEVCLRDLRGTDTSNHRVKQAIKRLQAALVAYNYFGRRGKEWRSAQLLGECSIVEATGVLTYSFPKSVRELLYSPEIYARINLKVQSELNSKYALILYELIQLRVHNQRTWKVTPTALMDLFDAENSLRRFSNFKQRALDPAVSDINELTDINLSAAFEKDPSTRCVETIVFTFSKRKARTAIGGERGPKEPAADWRGALKSELGADTYNSWFARCSLEGNILQAPGGFCADYIRNNLLQRASAILRRDLVVVVAPGATGHANETAG